MSQQRGSLLRILRQLSSAAAAAGGQEAVARHAPSGCSLALPQPLPLLSVRAALGSDGAASSAPSTSGRLWRALDGPAPWAARGVATQPQARGGGAAAAVRLNALSDAPGASSERKRWGRGNGGGRGTYCGRGVKGQRARKGHKPGILFDGGQKGLKKLPKAGARPSNPVVHATVSLGTVVDWVKAGRLDAARPITMQDLRSSGAVAKRVLWGVKLLGRGAAQVDRPLHLQVSAASAPARAAVEAAGGSVTTVYYTQLGLRALLKPESFERKGRRLPSPPRAWPPRDNGKFDEIGQLPPPQEQPAPPALPPPAAAAAPAAAAPA